MKNLLIISFLITSFLGFSQDVIYKVNGDSIVGKVLEIDESKVYFRIGTNADVPRRSLSKQWIYKVVYASGGTEIFNKSGVVIEKRRGPDKRRYKRHGILSSGFFFEGMTGIAFGSRKTSEVLYSPSGNYIGTKESYNTHSYIAMNFRIGNKWYFHRRENYAIGLNVIWLRAGLLTSPDKTDGVIAPLSIGLASVFRFNKEVGLEVNTYTGQSLIRGSKSVTDLILGLNTKLRLNNFALGLDYGYAFNIFGKGHTNLLTLTAGMKF